MSRAPTFLEAGLIDSEHFRHEALDERRAGGCHRLWRRDMTDGTELAPAVDPRHPFPPGRRQEISRLGRRKARSPAQGRVSMRVRGVRVAHSDRSPTRPKCRKCTAFALEQGHARLRLCGGTEPRCNAALQSKIGGVHHRFVVCAHALEADRAEAAHHLWWQGALCSCLLVGEASMQPTERGNEIKPPGQGAAAIRCDRCGCTAVWHHLSCARGHHLSPAARSTQSGRGWRCNCGGCG